MFQTRLLIGVLVSVALLASCASGPKYTEVKDGVPAIKAAYGRLYFYRGSDSAMLFKPDIQVNEEFVGVSKPGMVFYVDLRPGFYEVASNGGGERVEVRKGEVRYVRFTAGVSGVVGKVYPELVSDSVGRSEIQDKAWDPDMKHLLRYPASNRF